MNRVFEAYVPSDCEPKKLFYENNRMPMKFPKTMWTHNNIAFTTGIEMFQYAAERILQKPGIFVPVAWAFVEYEPVKPLGFLCLDHGGNGGKYIFTALNYYREDIEAKRNKTPVDQICTNIDNLYRESWPDFKAKRGFITLRQRYSNRFLDTEAERVGKLLAHLCCGECLAPHDLYQLLE